MSREKLAKSQGYVFLDVLFGLFILGVGLATVLGFNHTLYNAQSQNRNYLEAINLASTVMEDQTHVLAEKQKAGETNYVVNISKEQGIFQYSVDSIWEQADLMKILVKVNWVEINQSREYQLERLFYGKEN